MIVLVLAFFVQIEREHLHAWFRGFFKASQRAYIDLKLDAIHEKISMWARGQIVLGLVIGILVYIALKILKIPNAETLAVLAGFTEFIPYVGPFIAAIPAVLIASTQDQGGFVWAAIVAGVYYVIQWCENNLLVPLIMKRAVGLSPIAIIFAMMAGISLPVIFQNPILGLLLAVPITTILSVFLNDLRRGPPVNPS
jgi:predicted PurR-regulated permease PerM